jgi:hypothetical protein
MLLRYLELRVAELEQAAVDQSENERRSATRSAVGQMITWLLLFVGYALTVGLVSASVLNAALLDPGQLANRVRAVLRYAGEAAGAVPDPIRGIVVSMISAIALLIFRSASFNVRSDIGGALFVGLTVFSLAGLSGAASSGTLGLLVALPGFVAAIVIVHELVETLRRLTGQWEQAEPTTPRWLFDRFAAIRESSHPRRHALLPFLFAGLPWLCVLLIAGSYVTKGGPLWWPSRLSMYGLGAWSLWGCLATPRVARIALWSIVPWAGLVGLQFSDSAVAVIFALAVVLLLYANVVLAVLRLPGLTDPEPQRQHEEPAVEPT